MNTPWNKRYAVQAMFSRWSGLKKIYFSLPFGQTALKVCLSGLTFFIFLASRQPFWSVAHHASDNAKLLAWQENLLVPDERLALFSSPNIGSQA